MKIKSVKNISKAPATFDEVKKWYEDHLSPAKMDFTDQKPYEVYSEGKWAGIFQCVDENTLVTMSNDSKKRICDIQIGDKVKTYCPASKVFLYKTVSEIYDQGVRECVQVTFNDNSNLILTGDHSVMSNIGWVDADKSNNHLILGNNHFYRVVKNIKLVGQRHVYDIEVDDTHTFIANNIVVHNCTSKGAQNFFIKNKPKSIIDIAALTSIYRPGPLAANVDKLWSKHEHEHYDWGHPLINETLNDTRSLLIFQEGVMSLANKVGGFPMEETDEVRRAIMKRSTSGGEAAKKKAAALKDKFVAGAVKNGVPQDIADKAYETILWMAGYSFNKSLIESQRIPTYTKNGTLKEIKQIQHVQPGDIVKSRDEKTKEVKFVSVKALHDHGKLSLVKLTLTSGEIVECTLDHKFRTVETGEMLPLHMIQKRGLSIVVEKGINK